MKQTYTPKYTIDEILANFDETDTMPRDFLNTFVVHRFEARKDYEDRKLLSELDAERIQYLDWELTGEDIERNYSNYIYTFSIDKRKFELEVGRDGNFHYHIGQNDYDDDVYVFYIASESDEPDTPKYTIEGILANFDKTKTMPREILDTFVVCEEYDEDLLSCSDASRICQRDRDITDHDTEKNYTNYIYTFIIDNREFEVSVGHDANYDRHFGWDEEDDVEVYEIVRDKNSTSVTLNKEQLQTLLDCCDNPDITKLLKDALLSIKNPGDDQEDDE